MQKFLVLLSWCIFMLILPAFSQAQTVVIDFEDGVFPNPVGTTVDGTQFASGWIYAVDSDSVVGGSPIANEPSGDKVAGTGTATVPSDLRITLPQPAEEVCFWYTLDTSRGTPQVYYYDYNDNLIGTQLLDVCGSTHCGSGCSGDPTGDWCYWERICFSAPNIAYIEFNIVALGSWGIDDLSYASHTAAIPTLSEWGMVIMSLILAGSALWILRRRQIS